MLRFEDGAYLWLLLIVPVLVLVRLWMWRLQKKKYKMLGDKQLLKQMMPRRSVMRENVKFSLVVAAISLVIVMIARPQMGSSISHDKRQGIEIMIAMDISNSMLAEDVVPNRLEKSKMMVENLIDHFSSDRIGLVVFAGDAFIQLPITSDYVSAKMFLQNIDPSLIQQQGTDIAQALQLCENSFSKNGKVGKAVIVITDGEDHEGGAVEAAKEAHKKGINVFILGIGDTKGAPIPMRGSSGSNGGYLTDNTGQTVMTKLNEQMCQEIAQAGEGKYIHVDNTADAQELLNDKLARLQRGETESVIYSEYDDQFQAVGWLVILVLLIEVCVMERKTERFNFKRLHKITVLLFLLSLSTQVSAKGGSVARYGKSYAAHQVGRGLFRWIINSEASNADRQAIRKGNKLYRQKQEWDKAETQYRKAVAFNKNNAQAYYNLGCALMQQGKDSSACLQFEEAIRLEKDKLRKSQSYHNIGVMLQSQKQFDAAIDAYKESLRLNPQDNETRYNLVLCQKQQKKKNQNKNNQNKNKNEDKNKNQNKNKQQQDKNKQDKQNPQPKPQPQQMSKDNAEQLLQAAMQNEKNTQQKLKKQNGQPKRKSNEMNW